MEARGIEPL